MKYHGNPNLPRVSIHWRSVWGSVRGRGCLEAGCSLAISCFAAIVEILFTHNVSGHFPEGIWFGSNEGRFTVHEYTLHSKVCDAMAFPLFPFTVMSGRLPG